MLDVFTEALRPNVSFVVQVTCDVNTQHVTTEREYFSLSHLHLLSREQDAWFLRFSEFSQSFVSSFSDYLCLCFAQGNVKDFQLWVISKRDNAPYPLIGQ